MWIIQEPKKVALWNKRHFEEKKTEITQIFKNIQYVYRVIQEESARLREMIVCVILSKKVHINMCPIFDGYGAMGIF